MGKYTGATFETELRTERETMKNPQYYELDLLKLLRALWRRMWAILLTAVLLAGAAYGVSAYVMTPMYEAEALMYVNNVSSPGSSSFSISSSELTAAQSLADTYIIILKARTTLTEVIQREELDYTYEELRDMVSSDTVNNTEVFNVRVTCEDPQEASRIANGIARVLPGKISDIVDGSSVRIVDYAVAPTEPVSPSILKFTIIGFLAGALLACIMIVIRTLLDTLIHDEEYLMQTYDLPILAVIPDHFRFGKQQNYYKYKSYQSFGRTEVKK